MKTMLKAFGIIAAAAVIVFTLSCGGGGGGGGGIPNPKNPDPKTPETEPKIVIEMTAIPAGSFWMGSPLAEPNHSSNEAQLLVTLTEGFNMGKYPVTQEQYEKVMGITIEEQEALSGSGTGLYGTGKDYPMYYVSWYDAVVFCNKLSVMEGFAPAYSIEGETDTDDWIDAYGAAPKTFVPASKWNTVEIVPGSDGYRLPTEAQWEYACRGDYPNKAAEKNTKPFGIGDGTKLTGDMANFNGRNSYDTARGGSYFDPSGTYLEKITPVGNYAAYANSYGLYDMHGNVREWCWDWYDASYPSTAEDPDGAVTANQRVIRNGQWNGWAYRSASRYCDIPGTQDYFYGFRLVRP